MRPIADFCPQGVETGAGLTLQDDGGHYLFLIAGTRHRCPPGERFYAGIGGHRNPVPIVIPCHRVIASDGSLGGYSGGGLASKRLLLNLEGALPDLGFGLQPDSGIN